MRPYYYDGPYYSNYDPNYRHDGTYDDNLSVDHDNFFTCFSASLACSYPHGSHDG